MSGKGSNRRPTDEAAYASGWDRIFKCGVPEQSNGGGPNPPSEGDLANVGASPTSAANQGLVYVDDASGRIVDEDYWPNG